MSAAAHLLTRANELATILQRVTGVSPADLMAARFIVEPQAAAIAAKNASFSDLQAIAEAHRYASDARQTDEFEHWDVSFISACLQRPAMSCSPASTTSCKSSAAATPGLS